MIVTLEKLFALAQKLQQAEEQCNTVGSEEVGIELEVNEIRIMRSLATDYIESAQEANRD